MDSDERDAPDEHEVYIAELSDMATGSRSILICPEI